MNNIDLVKELSQNFIDFSHEANCQRAFADARDGLKPGQRACLWEMHSKGYTSNKPHVKSAKISGGVIGTWWPHGDVAIYETFARMSQSWINNIPEVDWHGANGSIQISGEPAASRYTEARLSKATEDGLLYGIKKHNVPMKLNFSEDEEWPEVFPAILPRLMINGCQGIGSTVANVWIPHELSDLAVVINKYVKEGVLDYNNLAPSFPTGGIIINKDNLKDIYLTGKGKVILRGKATIEGNSILITEIPYQVYVEPLIDQIKNLAISDEIPDITNVINKSDKNRLLIEVVCDSSPSAVLSKLYQKTNLQKTYNANQMALVGKTPKLLNLKEYLDIYLSHNYDCIKNEFQYDLDKAKDRLEIVSGLIKALEDIDNIIALIKKSKSSSDAVVQLIKKYDFSERQAKSIVDMRLGKLAHLEKIELNKELNDLTSSIEKYNEIISNRDKQKDIFLDRFNSLVKKYGKNRKTELIQISEKPEEKEIQEVVPEDVVVITTKTGLIKRVPLSNFKVQRRGGKGIKNKDDAILDLVKTNTIDTMMFFSTKGKMYRILVDNIPVGTNVAKGVPISSLIKLESDESIVAVTSLHRKTTANSVVFVTKNGLIKKTALSDYMKTNRNNGIIAIGLKEGDSVVDVTFLEDEEVILITKNGMSIRFTSKEVPLSGRATKGVKAIKLNEGDEVISILPIHKDTDEVAVFSKSGLGKKCKLTEFSLQARGGKGLLVYKTDDAEGKTLVGAEMLSDEDNLLLIGNKTSICISAVDVPTLSRTGIGNILIKNNILTSVVKI